MVIQFGLIAYSNDGELFSKKTEVAEKLPHLGVDFRTPQTSYRASAIKFTESYQAAHSTVSPTPTSALEKKTTGLLDALNADVFIKEYPRQMLVYLPAGLHGYLDNLLKSLFDTYKQSYSTIGATDFDNFALVARNSLHERLETPFVYIPGKPLSTPGVVSTDNESLNKAIRNLLATYEPHNPFTAKKS